ncbi:hypothetical protein ONE63_007376 [Megalurothrips usitatus]|uniref:ATP synthase subunit b n=1 Tax=Megalurothrips usitatus TaxID=439358 RepID=A0AAV7XU31_9NEOP|nr:hypothetical protein ONE63_007376 [Megalurothrips usitatus]
MLSRLASRAVAQSQSLASRPMILAVQKASSAPSTEADKPSSINQNLEDPLDSYPRTIPKVKENPERDLVNFPRPVQKENPDPVRLAFVPEEFFDFFYKKTGVSGPYVFGAGVLTWLLSKEIYVLEHNFYNGLSFLLILAVIHNKLGPKIAEWADKEIKDWEGETREAESGEKVALKEDISDINAFNEKIEVYKDLMNVKREIASAALEVTYRQWSLNAYKEAKKRLDYQLDLANAERRISQKNMSSWITNSVLKSITPAQEAEALKKCISDLKSLSSA